MSRRCFLQEVAALPLFALPLSVATNAATPVQAEAASRKTIRFDKVKIKAPSVWKKLDVYHGATYELQYGPVKPLGDNYYDYVPILFEGYFEGYTSATGKPKSRGKKAVVAWVGREVLGTARFV